MCMNFFSIHIWGVCIDVNLYKCTAVCTITQTHTLVLQVLNLFCSFFFCLLQVCWRIFFFLLSHAIFSLSLLRALRQLFPTHFCCCCLFASLVAFFSICFIYNILSLVFSLLLLLLMLLMANLFFLRSARYIYTKIHKCVCVCVVVSNIFLWEYLLLLPSSCLLFFFLIRYNHQQNIIIIIIITFLIKRHTCVVVDEQRKKEKKRKKQKTCFEFATEKEKTKRCFFFSLQNK